MYVQVILISFTQTASITNAAATTTLEKTTTKINDDENWLAEGIFPPDKGFPLDPSFLLNSLPQKKKGKLPKGKIPKKKTSLPWPGGKKGKCHFLKAKAIARMYS